MRKHKQADVDEARTRTVAALADIGVSDLTESDLSYITSDLLDAYEGALEKQASAAPSQTQNQSELGLADDQDYPCFIGNSPVFISGKTWKYQNNNSSDGCDSAAHLCGTGKFWRAEFSRLQKDRYCANGLKGVLGWS
jgi:hypothetical protein